MAEPIHSTQPDGLIEKIKGINQSFNGNSHVCSDCTEDFLIETTYLAEDICIPEFQHMNFDQTFYKRAYKAIGRIYWEYWDHCFMFGTVEEYNQFGLEFYINEIQNKVYLPYMIDYSKPVNIEISYNCVATYNKLNDCQACRVFPQVHDDGQPGSDVDDN